MPICVEGGAWNHASGVPGPAGVVSVGDGERAKLRVLCMRVATASESSLDSPSDEDAEPESESSKPIIGSVRCSAPHRVKVLTVNQLCELALRDGIASVQSRLDIVAMPVGAEVHALFVDICEGSTKADVACTSLRARSGSRSGRVVLGKRTRCLVDDIARN